MDPTSRGNTALWPDEWTSPKQNAQLESMRRETSNALRYVFEELLPPVLRDSAAFAALARLAIGPSLMEMSRFRTRAVHLTDDEYETLYRNMKNVHDGTDNSDACIARIANDLVGASVCDVGCGSGYLVERLREAKPEIPRFAGVDFVLNSAERHAGIEWHAAKIEALPFADRAFDTVVCTHVIEHILDYRRAIEELRRITARRLIIVVPREREGRYTFNPHFHFFPYKESFLRAIAPAPAQYVCEDIGRDIYFREDR